MFSFDFNRSIQDIFNKKIKIDKKINWNQWLKIHSKEEYEELAFKLSGIANNDDHINDLNTIKTNSRNFAVEIVNYLNNEIIDDFEIFCHTSGTTDAKISNLKWFHMNDDMIKNIWIPGMTAIFESSGLNHNSSAIIFVPSRTSMDGIKTHKERKYVSLYSSEFSQRVVISIIKPKQYLFYEYKDAFNLEILTRILSMESPSVISAPAAIILGWADLERLKRGIAKSLRDTSEFTEYSSEIYNYIKKEGLHDGVNKLKRLLSEKISSCTLIFSTSSLKKQQWSSISDFMNWEDDKKNFTNLYVASEIGPFACNLTSEIAKNNELYVFPLTIPSIEAKGKIEIISRTKEKRGVLLVSYINKLNPRINIETGDVITIKNNESGLPLIGGTIVRNNFRLKYPMKISPIVKPDSNYDLFVGDYFSFQELEIYDPKSIIECLKGETDLLSDSLLLKKNKEKSKHSFELFFSTKEKINNDFSLRISNCLKEKQLSNAIKTGIINFRAIPEKIIEFKNPRSELLEKVRNGSVPKGILKKWPFYVLKIK